VLSSHVGHQILFDAGLHTKTEISSTKLLPLFYLISFASNDDCSLVCRLYCCWSQNGRICNYLNLKMRESFRIAKNSVGKFVCSRFALFYSCYRRRSCNGNSLGFYFGGIEALLGWFLSRRKFFFFRSVRISSEKRVLASPCQPVRLCPHVSARPPLDGFPWNLILGTFTEICRVTANLIELGQKYQTLYMST
jgi:hypothetical protein